MVIYLPLKIKFLIVELLKFVGIKPNDYIMNNTGYDYPEYTDGDLKTIIEDYYKTIYPDEEVRE